MAATHTRVLIQPGRDNPLTAIITGDITAEVPLQLPGTYITFSDGTIIAIMAGAGPQDTWPNWDTQVDHPGHSTVLIANDQSVTVRGHFSWMTVGHEVYRAR